MQLPMPNRAYAGQALADDLTEYKNRGDVIVLALPRGGLPVALEIARCLNAPLDLMLVRKLGTPGFPELAMGAIASGGIKVLNQQVIQGHGIKEEAIAEVEAKERAELERRETAYRGERPYPELKGKTVILVDDGLATGSTMKAAIDAVHQHQPKAVVVAVPVAPPDTIYALGKKADHIICPEQPALFSAIGQWYDDFSQVSDDEVIEMLATAWKQEGEKG